MRILKVTQSYYPFLDRGGPAVKVRALAHGLAARGHSVTVLTADLSGGRHRELGRKNRWGWRAAEANTEIIYLSTALTFRALTINPHLAGFCRQRLAEFDVVHIYGLYDLLGPTVASFAKHKGVPYLIEPMGMFRPIDRAFFLKRVWHRLFGTRMTASARRIIATAELERKELIEGGVPPEKVFVRYNPVDLGEYATLPSRGGFRKRWNIAPDEPLILFLSRLIPRKGADLLIEAFAQAFPDRGTLVIAGPEGQAGYLNKLRGVAGKCGVAERVRLPGGLYGEEKKKAFADADVFALPSSYENFANAVAEAVASGLPVVITETCGIHSLIQGRAGLVIAREKNALAGALRDLISNPALRERFRAGREAITAELSPEKTVRVLERVYEESRR